MSGKDDYTDSAPPLGFDQAWIDNQLKNGSGVDLLTAQILSQKTYDKWTGEGYGSIVGNAHAMAQRLANAGISRLEDFGRAPVYKPAEIMEWSLNGQPVYENRGHGFYTSVPTGMGWDENGNYGMQYGNRYLSAAETQKIQPSKYGMPGTAYASDIYGDYAYDTIVPVSADKLKTVNGVPSYESGVGFVNKKTGKPVAGDAQSGTVFDKTFAGDGSTTFQVQFNDAGMPIFFSQYGGSSSDWGTVSGVLSVASFIPGVGPFAAALNAVGNAYNGNTVGAVLSALSAAGSFGAQYGTIDPSSANAINGMDAASDAAAGATSGMTSVANWFAQNAGAIQTAQQGVAALNALDKGNLAGVISGLTNIAPQIGVTIPSDIIKPISAAATAAAISKGDWAGAMAAAGTLTDNPALRQDAKLANQAAKVIDAVKSGNPTAILSAGMGFAKQADLGSSTFKSLASSFGVELDPDQLVKFENAAPDSEEFDAATKGLVKLYDEKETAAKEQPAVKEVLDQDKPDTPVTQEELANIVNPPAAEQPAEPTPAPVEPVESVEPVGPPTEEEQQPAIDDLIKELEATQPAAPPTPPVVDEVLEPVLPDESVTQDELANIVNPPAEPAEPEVVEPTPTPVEPVGPPTQEEQQPAIDDFIKELESSQPPAPAPKDPLEEILSKPQEEMTAEDWAKLYGTPTTNPETGETTTGGDTAELPNQDFGTEPVVPDDFTGEGPAIWKPNENGTQTMTADDGSTITIDQDGNVVGSTEAPKGNLPGETPPVTPKPPVTPPKLPVTPPTTPTTPVAPAANTGNLAALLALLGGMGGQQQSAQQPVQENAADIKSFEEMGFGDLFGTELGLTAPQTKTVKAASGGSIDELLKLLRS